MTPSTASRKPNAQYNAAAVDVLVMRVTHHRRRRMFDRFTAVAQPQPGETILDFGVTSDWLYASSIYLEARYPHKDRPTAAVGRRRRLPPAATLQPAVNPCRRQGADHSRLHVQCRAIPCGAQACLQPRRAIEAPARAYPSTAPDRLCDDAKPVVSDRGFHQCSAAALDAGGSVTRRTQTFRARIFCSGGETEPAWPGRLASPLRRDRHHRTAEPKRPVTRANLASDAVADQARRSWLGLDHEYRVMDRVHADRGPRYACLQPSA